jgi:hypothetical protein
MTVKRVGDVWCVIERGVILKPFDTFKQAVRWMLEETRKRESEEREVAQ